MKLIALAEQPELGVSHNPEIRKRIMVAPGVVPRLTGFSQAVFEPGQVCTPHAHATMVEVYFVMAGTGTITVDSIDYTLESGLCVVVEAGEVHSVANTGTESLVVVYFGIATDPVI